MSFVAFIENNMNVYLDELRLEEDRSPITDAVLKAHFGEIVDPVPVVTNATNASPIVITSPAHGLSDGDQVIVSQVRGNNAANGLFLVDNVTANTFELVDSTGDGAYFDGGVWYRAVRGAVNLTMEYITGTACSFIGRLDRDNNMVKGRRYMLIVDCTNYGVKFETAGLARVRS